MFYFCLVFFLCVCMCMDLSYQLLANGMGRREDEQ